ncbi:MAG: sulfur oxidation c-type cytochrome SoxX [Aquificae bacterium]|nr:sulfur oxidation c-type cytochrome SoxX [Aquificota bacterium]
MKFLKKIGISLLAVTSITVLYADAQNCPGIESPDGRQALLKDIPPGPTIYAIPDNCKLTDPKFVQKKAEEGRKLYLSTKIANCVACHCAPNATGCGDVGPDLTGYMNTLFKAEYIGGQKKDIQWLFQRVADFRVQIPPEFKDNPYFNTMTVNLTTGALTYDQVCAITAYLMTLK